MITAEDAQKLVTAHNMAKEISPLETLYSEIRRVSNDGKESTVYLIDHKYDVEGTIRELIDAGFSVSPCIGQQGGKTGVVVSWYADPTEYDIPGGFHY